TYTDASGCFNSKTRTITVKAPPVISEINATPGACQNRTRTYSINPISGVLYFWTVPEDWTINSGQGTPSINVTHGTLDGNVTVNVSHSSNSDCKSTKSKFVTLSPLPFFFGIDNEPPFCIGDIATFEIVDVDHWDYFWDYPGDWTEASNDSRRPWRINLNVGTMSGEIKVFVEESDGQGGTCASDEEILPVNPTNPPVTPEIVGPDLVCASGPYNYSAPGPATSTYTWTVPGGWTINSVQNTNTINVTVGTSGGVITVKENNGCDGDTKSKSVSIRPNPVVSEIVVSPSPCQNSTFSRYFVADIANATFTWSVPADWTIDSGQGTHSINVTHGILNGKVNVIVKPDADSQCETKQSRIITLDVPPILNPIVGPENPCVGQAVDYEVNQNDDWTYVWSYPTDWTELSGQGTNKIKLVPGFDTGEVTVLARLAAFENSCGSDQATMPVTPKPFPNVEVGPDIPICSGDEFSRPLTGTVAGTTYSWTVSHTPGISGATAGSGNIINQTLTNSGSTNGTATYTVTPFAGGCVGQSQSFVVTVKPIPVVSVPLQSITIGDGGTTDISLSSTVGVTTYSWAVSDLVNVSANPTDGSISPIQIMFNLLDPDTDGSANVTITPTANTCQGAPLVVNVTIVAGFVIDPDPICENQSATLQPIGSGTHEWYDAPTGGNLLSSDNPFITPVLTQTTTYFVEWSFDNLGDPRTPVTVIVNPIPDVAATNNNNPICSGGTTDIVITNPNNITGTTFSWTVTANAAITGESEGSGPSIAQTLTNTGNVAHNVTYTITPTADGCNGTPIDVVVTVNPEPVGSAVPPGETICSGESTNINLNSTVSGTTFTWTVSAPAG
ncbi:MAG: hypothetical protein MJA84_17350, partial [Firmicutes bacterium]|nr:hypothetical protein [Bacillota bacterium]